MIEARLPFDEFDPTPLRGMSDLGKAKFVARRRYRELVGALRHEGTEVMRIMAQITDPSEFPFRFTDALHEFIFPKQDVKLLGKTFVMANNVENCLYRSLEQRAAYDRSLALGKVVVIYGDVENAVSFEVIGDPGDQAAIAVGLAVERAVSPIELMPEGLTVL